MARALTVTQKLRTIERGFRWLKDLEAAQLDLREEVRLLLIENVKNPQNLPISDLEALSQRLAAYDQERHHAMHYLAHVCFCIFEKRREPDWVPPAEYQV